MAKELHISQMAILCHINFSHCKKKILNLTWHLNCQFLIARNTFSTFSSMFLNPDSFSNLNFYCSNLLDIRNLQEQVKKNMLPEIVLTFHYLNNLFQWSQRVWKFLAFSFKFQKFFSITRFFSRSRSEQFWYQNTS